MFVKSISYSQAEILRSILHLHCQTPIELDPTYGKGNMYKDGIPEPLYKFDLHPQHADVQKSYAERLPLNNESIQTMLFDPPFLATKGKSLCLDTSSNSINKRFGVYPTEKELFTFYREALQECYRILKPKGVLIFKCQDKVSAGKQYISHNFILNEAANVGFYCKDVFILLAKQRLVAHWQRKNQKHARKYHCYFLVLVKSKSNVRYAD